MRDINNIVFHCTGTSQNTTIESILNYWKERLGWKNPGYHIIIEPCGKPTQLHPFSKPSNGARGHNSDSIHISYIGGKDKDDRTPEQIITQKAIALTLHGIFPNAEIKGHRDFKGVSKSCPRFDAKTLLT